MRKKFTLFLFASFLYSISFTQSIIDYQTWDGTDNCNAFGTGISVSGTINGVKASFAHSSSIGQPLYSNASNYVLLESKTENNGSTIKGTAYRIYYNFKPNYIYKVTINASCVGGNTARLRLLQDNGGALSKLCNGSDIIDPNASGNGYVSNVITSGSTWSNYTFDLPVYATQWNYLNVAAIPSANGNLQTINIRKITITETPPAPDFTVNTLNVPCGSTSPQTFTVTNIYNSTGITSYEWDLGANNGWVYNGNPAPQYISTTTNALILTPSGNSTLQNVAVTVRINQQDYRTYTGMVNMTTPSYSISGVDNFCTSANYEILNLPPGSSVNWSVSPAGVVSVNQIGNGISLNRITDGYINLTAIVSNVCGNISSSKSNIVAGIIVPIITCPQNMGVAFDPYTVIDCIVGTNNSYLTFQWDVIGGTIISGQGTNHISVQLGAGGTHADNAFSVSVRASTNCGGWSNYGSFNGFIKGGQGDINPIEFNMIAFPNPVSTFVNIETSEDAKEDYDLQLYDFSTNKLSLSQKFKKGNKSAKLQISHLRKGQYVLVMKNAKGKIIKTQQIILR